MHPHDRDLISLNEAAALLGVHRDTVIRWTQDGHISAARLGSKRFYSRQALVAAITPPATATSNRAAV